MGKTMQYHSCYVVDVREEGERWRLTDSTQRAWFVYKADAAEAGFDRWLRNSFLAGKAGTLTVFEYEDRGDDPDFECVVTSFMGDAAGLALNG